MKRFILVLSFVVLAVYPAPAAETPKARAMLVLDASGSMWGQIGGKSKIEIAREVIGDLMADWDQGVHLGLSAYGHRSKGDCNDIETLVKAGPDTNATIVGIVNQLNPKGKTPLSASVKMAAEELGYSEEPATVILVSDGIENCGIDPCALGRSLEATGIDFTAHVIGFDVRPEDRAGLICLAENTGGKFLSAGTASELTNALQQVAEEVRTGADSVYVIIDNSGERYQGDVTWHVFATDEAGAAVGDRIDASVDDILALRQPPGRYLVQAFVGQAVRGEQLIEIVENETREHEIDLRAGTFNLSGTMTQGGDTISRGDIYWYIYPYQADGALSGSYAYSNVGRNIIAELPPGKYQIRGQYGDAYVRTDVTAKPGETENMIANFNAGVIGLSGTFEGNPIERDIYWYAYRLNEDETTENSYLAAKVYNKIWFTLNAGKYRIAGTYGQHETFVDIVVGAGEQADEVVIFGGGQ
jgi:Ca-activated chloride channel homolog